MVMLVGCNFNGANADRGQGGSSDADGMISAANTDLSSQQFPHTKAICIQPAKYEYVIEKGTNLGVNVEQPQKRRGTPAPPADTTQTPTKDDRSGGEEMNPSEGAVPQTRRQEETVPQTQTRSPERREESTGTPEQTETTPEQGREEAAPQTVNEAERRVVELTNVERRNNGLPELSLHTELSRVARIKSEDMRTGDYFSHTSPTHGSPFDMIRDNGISYRTAGENIARGQRTPEQVVQSWMNSTGHRENILNADYTHIGVGYDENGHFWTQMFIRE